MSQFSYQATQDQPLTNVTLTVGEEARPIVLKAVSTGDVVKNAFFLQRVPLVRVDEFPTPRDLPTPLRILSLTGVRMGAGSFDAVAPPGNTRPLAEFGVSVRDIDDKNADLVYSGKYLYWRRELPQGVANAYPVLFAATSGLMNHQYASQQSNKGHGPVPEGLYAVATSIDPAQNSVDAANKRGDMAFANPDPRIQFLPVGGSGPTNENWGTLRVQLVPIAGNMYYRNGFYLHNSEKGFSHGCIECGKTRDGVDFFSTLLAYAKESHRKPRLIIRVKYSYPEQSTLGKTERKKKPTPSP